MQCGQTVAPKDSMRFHYSNYGLHKIHHPMELQGNRIPLTEGLISLGSWNALHYDAVVVVVDWMILPGVC